MYGPKERKREGRHAVERERERERGVEKTGQSGKSRSALAEREAAAYIYIVGIGNVASSLVVAAGPEGMLREGMGCQATYVHP